MNERIKELIQQMEWEEVGADLYGKTFDGCMTGEALQKFAELIVRECLSYTKDGDIDFMKFMIKNISELNDVK